MSAQVSAALPGSAQASKYISEGERSGMASNFNQGHIGKCRCAARGYYPQHLSWSCIPAACSIPVLQQKEMGKHGRSKKPVRKLKFCCRCVVCFRIFAPLVVFLPKNPKHEPCCLPASNGRVRHNVFQRAQSFGLLDSS